MTPGTFPRFFFCAVCGGQVAADPAEPDYGHDYFAAAGRPAFLGRLLRPLLGGFLGLRVRRVRSLLTQRGAVLDYGCGDGKLVQALRQKGIQAIGYEPSASARAIASNAGLPVWGELVPQPDGYELVMFWHSLEHVDAPFEVLNLLRSLLRPRGKLLIAVPNAASWEAKIAKDRWFHYDFPFHRIHFTPRAITMLLERAGFRLQSIDYLNLEYTMSGIVQTFLNYVFPKNVLYGIVSHRRLAAPRGRASAMAGASIAAAAIASPLLFVFYLTELLFRKTGAMVVIAHLREKSRKESTAPDRLAQEDL